MAAPTRKHDRLQKEETDLTSPDFNPLAALYSSSASVPYPNVQLFNNLAEYESAMKGSSERPAMSVPIPMDASSAATAGSIAFAGNRSSQMFDYGHGSGDTTPASFGYGSGSSGSTYRGHSSRDDRSGNRVLDYGRQENWPGGDYTREPSYRKQDSESSSYKKSDLDACQTYSDPDPYRQSNREQDPYRQSDRGPDTKKQSDRQPDPNRQSDQGPDTYKQSDRHPDPNRQSDQGPDPNRQSNQQPDPNRQSNRQPDQHRQSDQGQDTYRQSDQGQDTYRQSDRESYRQSSASLTHRHSLHHDHGADMREKEYLDRQGFSDRDCEHYKISKRDRQSAAPPFTDTKEHTKSGMERKGDDAKFTSASVGGAKGAWSYDKVEKVVKEEKPTEKKEEELPDSFEVVYTQSSDYMDENRNVITRMNEYSESKSGPLHILYRCMKEKLQARVWTRSAVCVRGICKGYIVAFDKHSNLAMMDVDEFFRNPAMKGMRMKSKKKIAAKQPHGYIEPVLPCEATWLGLRKEKFCVRHLNQVFIRGDNVVSVSIVQDWS